MVVTNPEEIVTDPITGDTMTCQELFNSGENGDVDEEACTAWQLDQTVYDSCGCDSPIPPELIGEWIGDCKLPGSKTGHCASMEISSEDKFASELIGEPNEGFCNEIEDTSVRTATDEGVIVSYECTACSDNDVFNIRDGTGPSEKYNEYSETTAACGKFMVDSNQGLMCVVYRTSLLAPDTLGDDGDDILVNTLTVGHPEGECPADVEFDSHQLTFDPNISQAHQLRHQNPGDLLDPSTWECPPSRGTS